MRHPQPEPAILATLQQLTREGRIVITGAIRQGLLSGIRHDAQFEKLRRRLQAYPDFIASTKEYEQAARFLNLCRQNGVQGSSVDFLICSIAVANDFLIYSSDKDFVQYQKHIPIQLFDQ